MKSFVWAAMVSASVLCGPAAALPGAEGLRDVIEGKLSESLGAPVKVGSVELAAGGTIRLEELKLRALTASAVEVTPDFAALFGGQLRLSRVVVHGLRGSVNAGAGGGRWAAGLAQLFGERRLVNLTAGIAGITIAGLDRPLKIANGRAVLKGGALTVTPLVATVGNTRLSGSLRVADALGRARLDVRLAGPVDLHELAGGGVSGRGELSLTGSGSPAAPKLALALRSDAVRVSAGGRTFVMSDFRARPVTGKGRVALEDLSANLGGARLTGRAVPGARTELAVRIAGARLGNLGIGGTGRNSNARVDLTFNGSVGGGAPTGRGSATVSGASVDLSRDPQLAKHMRKVEKGESGAALMGLLLGSQAGESIRQKASYYGEVLDRLMAAHRLGPVRVEYVLTPGRIALDPISGPNLSGRARVMLNDGNLLGYLSWLRLAGVRFTGVRLTGSVSDPKPQVDPETVELERSARR